MTTRRWSNEEIELFHDGQLAPDQAAALEHQLLTDADLQLRLDRLAAIDRLTVAALTAPPRVRTAPAPRLTGLGFALAAAVLALLGIAVSLVLQPRSPASAPRIAVQPPAERAAPADPAPLFWRVADFDVLEPADAQTAAALAAGDVDAAVDRATDTDADARAAALLELGRSLRSAATAQAALDRLDIDAQLEACRVWSMDPSLRPIVFAHLSRLNADPHLRDRLAALIRQLSELQELRPWIRSYGLSA